MQTLYHKKNELFEVEFFQDKECTIPFDFTNSKNIYINGQFDLQVVNYVIESSSQNAQIFIPYIPQDCINCIMSTIISRNCDNKEPDDYDNVKVFTLTQINKMWDEDKIETITPNLSKYIPKDNAVLFLNEEDKEEYQNCVLIKINSSYMVATFDNYILCSYDKQFPKNHKNSTIFLPRGTQAELQKANEVAKELKEKYGVDEVNLFVLHCFVKYDILHYEILNIDESDYFSKTPEEAFKYIQNTLDCDDDFVEKYIKEYDDEFRKDFEKKKNDFFKSLPLNKIITTDSTGILEPQNAERLQVIDCKEIFEEYLKTER